MSAVRRFIEESPFKTYTWQARSIQESMMVINNAMPLLPCGKFMRVKYDDFVQVGRIIDGLEMYSHLRIFACFDFYSKHNFNSH